MSTANRYIYDDGTITINPGKRTLTLRVTNTGDRAVQVGSHFHFFEANRELLFDRHRAWGMRLNIPAGLAVRFEPGDSKEVQLVDFGGRRILHGFSALAEGALDDPAIRERGLQRTQERGFKTESVPDDELPADQGPYSISKAEYGSIYGPTTGDRIQLADTNLVIELTDDANSRAYGDESVYGGGKAIRDGMAQDPQASDAESVDTVITSALIVDAMTGIIKADIGIKDGRIVGIGKAGNPHTQDGVDPQLIIGPNTEVIAGEHRIVTAGGIDSHIHFISPQQAEEGLSNGITTFFGGGTGPAEGTKGTTCTPGESSIGMMLRAADDMPVNIGILGKGSGSLPEALESQIAAGAAGLKIHEDWGATPAVIDNALKVCDDHDVQLAIHTDTLNESGFFEDTRNAIGDRTIHTFHSEGAGGGHAPDILRVTGMPSVLPASTNPTLPYTVNSAEELLDMVMVCHHLSHDIPEDVSFAESRVRPETIAAETVLHDRGVISIFSSDSQAMGRVGETWARAFQTAHHCKAELGPLPEDRQAAPENSASVESTDSETDTKSTSGNDNHRVLRYVAKVTCNPAIAAGVNDYIGSLEVGKVADIVLWPVSSVAAKPQLVIRSGHICWSLMGDPNASLPTPEPVVYRPMFGNRGHALPHSRITFMSSEAINDGVPAKLGLTSTVLPVHGCRHIGKKDMVRNCELPKITVDPDTYEVRADGEPLTIAPADKLPLAQLHYLF